MPSTKQARLVGKPVPRDETYTLHTIKSVRQDMRIRIGKTEPVFSKGLLDSGSETNLVSQKFIKQMNFPTPKMSTEKLTTIDGRRIQAYGVHLLNFEITDKLGHTRYFKDTFLACDCESTFILGMPWLQLANPNIDWTAGDDVNHIEWKKYNAKVALETTRRVQLTNAESFAKEALNTSNKAYVMHVKHIPESEGLSTTGKAVSSMDLKQRDYDEDKVVLPQEYHDMTEVFSDVDANKLSEHGPQDHAINLIDNRQPPFMPLYNLSEVELTVLRQYIDKHLANKFIRPSKSPAGCNGPIYQL